MPKLPKHQSRKQKYRKINQFERSKITVLYQQQKKKSFIAMEMKLSWSTVSNIIKKFEDSGNINRKSGSGRPRKTTIAQDRLIIRQIKKNPFISTRKLSIQLSNDYGINVSRN